MNKDNKNLIEYLNYIGYKNMPVFLNKYLNVSSLVRLKKICYFCGMDYASKSIYDFSEYVTRFDHSLSTALLTWNYTNSKVETLAALFHDIATPCFSHVIDYMNKDYANQESTEEKTEEILRNDIELKELLKEDNIEIDDIIDFKKYSIVDTHRPKLCADRLDGLFLTGMYWTKTLTIEDVKNIIDDVMIITNEDNEKEIGFEKIEIGRLVLETSEIIDEYCHSNEDNYMMELLADITRRTINNKKIKYDDLFVLTEDKLMNIFEEENNYEIKKDLKLFKEIKREDVPNTLDNMSNVKHRELNPLVKDKRIKEY